MYTALIIFTVTLRSIWRIKNKRRYQSDQSINQLSFSSREIAVLDMSTAILHNTFKTTASLIDATVNETLW